MNAKKELIDHIGDREVKYVQVIRKRSYENKETIEGEIEDVLPRLDFEYDNGYGGQELEGTIWYSDGTWSDRGEYDGSEWWEHLECPYLPNTKFAVDTNEHGQDRSGSLVFSAWATTKQSTPDEGEWVLHTYAGVRPPEYGLYARGRFWRNDGPESFPATHWLRIPMINPNT